MPLVANAGFVDLRALTCTQDGPSPLILHYYTRRPDPKSDPILLFLLRELDTKIIRPGLEVSLKKKGNDLDQIIKAVMTDILETSQLYWASQPELLLLRSMGLITARDSSKVALVEPATAIRILRAFGQDFTALIIEGVLLTLVSESKVLRQVLTTSKSAIYHYNWTQGLPNDLSTSFDLVQNLLAENFSAPYPPTLAPLLHHPQ